MKISDSVGSVGWCCGETLSPRTHNAILQFWLYVVYFVHILIISAKSVGFVSVGNKALALMYTGDSGDLVTIKFKYFLYNQTLHCGGSSFLHIL